MSVVKNMDSKQELGIFFEITPSFAKDAGATYQKTDAWFRANSLLSTGYTQSDRIKLINTIFSRFKNIFGYYPKSVGAWWIDAYSLSYMQQKYGIVSNLDVADQYSRDGYQVWGQYWAMPYYPSKLDSEIPANSVNNKLGIVTIQWAPRDPLNGYGDGKSSLYSTQDYREIGLPDSYFQKLLNLYALNSDNSYGQMKVGLEADLSANVYGDEYANQLDYVNDDQDQGLLKAVTMTQFSNWYNSHFKDLTPSYIIHTPDLLGQKIESFWYQSPFYRIGLNYDQTRQLLKVVDLRVYQNNFADPYFTSPNDQLTLEETTPYVVDSVTTPATASILSRQALQSEKIDNGKLKFSFPDKSKIIFSPQDILLDKYSEALPDLFTVSPYLHVNSPTKSNIHITSILSFPFPPEGKLVNGLSPEILNFLQQKKSIVVELVLVLAEFGIILLSIRKSQGRTLKVVFALLFIDLVVVLLFISHSMRSYFISQSEIAALLFLSSLPKGSVLVSDQTCLQCSWHTDEEPAVYANKRDYVGEISGKVVRKNSVVFDAKSREIGETALEKSKVKYIYLTQYEVYSEVLPFSPGDYGLEKVYQNANSQIWEVKKSQ